MLFYFVLGAFLFRYKDKIKDFFIKYKYRRYIPLLLIILGLSGLMTIKFYFTGSFYWNNIYIEKGYHWVSTAILALGMYLFIQNKSLTKIEIFMAHHIGTNTMGIYYLHWPMLAAYWKYLNNYFIDYYSVRLNIIKTCIITALCLAIITPLKRIPVVKELVK